MPLQLTTPRLLLRVPTPADAGAMSHFIKSNSLRFEQYGPKLSSEQMHDEYFEEKFRHEESERVAGRSIRFLLCQPPHESLIIGDCHFTNVVRGIFLSCHLGYRMDANYEGKGLMKEGLAAAIRYIFDEWKLHRVEANIMPDNRRSIALVKSLGFEEEGLAKKYLRINGVWQDHLHYVLLNENVE